VLVTAPLAKHNPTGNTNEIRIPFPSVSWLQIRTREPDRFHSHHPNYTVTVVTFSTELDLESRSLSFDLISDTDVSAGRRRPLSVNATVLIRTCGADVRCVTDDAGPLRTDLDCSFDMPRATRMRISVGAMPCVIWAVSSLKRILGLHGWGIRT